VTTTHDLPGAGDPNSAERSSRPYTLDTSSPLRRRRRSPIDAPRPPALLPPLRRVECLGRGCGGVVWRAVAVVDAAPTGAGAAAGGRPPPPKPRSFAVKEIRVPADDAAVRPSPAPRAPHLSLAA
jgi:hypothetical protein